MVTDFLLFLSGCEVSSFSFVISFGVFFLVPFLAPADLAIRILALRSSAVEGGLDSGIAGYASLVSRVEL